MGNNPVNRTHNKSNFRCYKKQKLKTKINFLKIKENVAKQVEPKKEEESCKIKTSKF